MGDSPSNEVTTEDALYFLEHVAEVPCEFLDVRVASLMLIRDHIERLTAERDDAVRAAQGAIHANGLNLQRVIELTAQLAALAALPPAETVVRPARDGLTEAGDLDD